MNTVFGGIVAFGVTVLVAEWLHNFFDRPLTRWWVTTEWHRRLLAMVEYGNDRED